MKIDSLSRICLIPNVSGLGGMVSFRQKLVEGLGKHRISVTYDLADKPYEVILVIGGTRDLVGLWREKHRGVRIVQRLDGMNWIHRQRRTGWRHYLRAEYGNIILSLIRARVADQIVYQSEFSRQWWERVYGSSHIPWQVVHNGVDLDRYKPGSPETTPIENIRVLLVEGTIGSGYEWGLLTAIEVSERIAASDQRKIELMVAGRVLPSVKRESMGRARLNVTFLGEVPPDRIPAIDRSAHVLYAADINPACPNSVIEALACGLPVAAFDTGALPEIVTEGSGELVAYGGDPWKLEPPDIDGLGKAITHILDNQASYRNAARRRADQAFGLDRMVEGYLKAMNLA